jgi:predicted regulator of Ras-like GTPase activity (Roadblock/LC7/MglB family)
VVEILPHKSDVKSEVQEKPGPPSEQPLPHESPAPVPAEDPPREDVEKRATPVPKTGLFSSLPVFRKNETATEGEPPRQPAVRESGPPPVLERLWKLDPQDELAEADALQSLFMTEEKLTLEKVVSKAGELPGLDACVLAHGDRVICASKAPAGTDLQSLSGQAMAMLSQIRESSEKMGLGSVPAVTLHADRGVISFLHRGELCLLVLHTDRGFVPGVRERLQEMLVHLDDARPSLPAPQGP